MTGWQPRPRPRASVFDGRWCRLEPWARTHGAVLYQSVGLANDSQWTYMPAGPFDDEASFTAYLQARADDPDEVLFTITPFEGEAAGKPAGFCSLMRIDPGIGTIEVGGILFTPPLAGTRAATESMFLLARYVFGDLGYRRYEWKCDALNGPSRAAAARLGFGYEGTWRNATMYKDRNRDTAWFAITDDDWRRLEPAYARWLREDNFVDGRQQSRLSELTADALTTGD